VVEVFTQTKRIDSLGTERRTSRLLERRKAEEDKRVEDPRHGLRRVVVRHHLQKVVVLRHCISVNFTMLARTCFQVQYAYVPVWAYMAAGYLLNDGIGHS
jgi:hypothetical protein